MARIRSVKPELRTSLTVAEWPREVRYFWVLLWGYLDDEGRGADVPKLIMSDCFPLDDDLSASDIDKWLDVLAMPSPGGGPASICRYTVAGRSFLHAPRWKNHQRPQHPTPSKYPPCNRGGDCGTPSRGPHEILMSPHEDLSGSFRSPGNAPKQCPGASPQATEGADETGHGPENARILHLPSSGAFSCGSHEDLRSPHESRSGNAMLHTPSTSPSTKAVDGEVEDQKPFTSEIAPRPSDTHPGDPPAGISGSPDSARGDVERVCAHLADRVEANGSRRPAVTARWRDAARLMLDRDGRTEDQVRAVIDWCQDDSFWKANILSMPKLREQFDRLRLQAEARGSDTPSRGHRTYQNPQDQSVYDRGFR